MKASIAMAVLLSVLSVGVPSYGHAADVDEVSAAINRSKQLRAMFDFGDSKVENKTETARITEKVTEAAEKAETAASAEAAYQAERADRGASSRMRYNEGGRHDNEDVDLQAPAKRLRNSQFKKAVLDVPMESTVIFEKPAPTYKEDYRAEDCQLLPYSPGLTNDIMLRVGYVTDITLPRGDSLQRITSGDSQRFKYETFYDRSSSTWHLYVQPLQNTASTNIVISTDKHIFHADLKVAEFCLPSVKWDIPDMVNVQSLEHVQFKVNNVNELHFKYSRRGGRHKSWTPRSVFDDKQLHTFINFNENELKREAPIVFMEINGSIELVPSKIQGNTMVVDRISDRFILKRGNEVIEYRRRG